MMSTREQTSAVHLPLKDGSGSNVDTRITNDEFINKQETNMFN